MARSGGGRGEGGRGGGRGGAGRGRGKGVGHPALTTGCRYVSVVPFQFSGSSVAPAHIHPSGFIRGVLSKKPVGYKEKEKLTPPLP